MMGPFAADPGPGYPDLLQIVVENPKNSTNRYEYDPELCLFRLSQALYSPIHYPGDYGFIPGTTAEDGDMLDVLVLVSDPSFSGCVIEVRPVGMLIAYDGEIFDQKVLSVPHRNPRYSQTCNIEDVFPHVRTEIEHFFEIYKELEGCKMRIVGWEGREKALEAIIASRERYLGSQQGSPQVAAVQ